MKDSILEQIYLEDRIRMDMPKTVAADKKLAQALESLKALKLEYEGATIEEIVHDCTAAWEMQGYIYGFKMAARIFTEAMK